MLEVQRRQQATSSNFRDLWKLPSQSLNSREQYKTITTRSGNVYKNSKLEKTKEPIASNLKKQVVSSYKHIKSHHWSNIVDVIRAKQEEKASIQTKCHTVLPFPQRYLKAKLDQQLDKFLKIFKQTHFNVPFFDAITKIPIYARFLKDTLSKNES